ncbi:hypothetical protein [Paenibacillus elgii]|uniref:hypothetical protein n=1 Tax=Paenibacillus elgii TaxID=189691 RepID=UPI0013D150E0|nr:hypothetical protein [Paenibacillus elgii]
MSTGKSDGTRLGFVVAGREKIHIFPTQQEVISEQVASHSSTSQCSTESLLNKTSAGFLCYNRYGYPDLEG